MITMRQTLLGLLATTAVSGVDIGVSSQGGNVTGGFHYGLLHEVRDKLPSDGRARCEVSNLTDKICRTLTTLAMAASMPS